MRFFFRPRRFLFLILLLHRGWMVDGRWMRGLHFDELVQLRVDVARQ